MTSESGSTKQMHREWTLYAILDEPYCHWESNLRAIALEFLNGIDSAYFDHLALRTHEALDDEESSKRAAVAARIGFFHGAETLFLLIGALLQAPHSPHAFMRRCTNENLRELVSRISKGAPLELMAPRLPALSWTEISKTVHERCNPDPVAVARTADLFAGFWKRLAGEYLDPPHVVEYNSLKHGFRVRQGGVHISVGPANVESPTEESMLPLGGSKYGSAFFEISRTGGDDKANRSTTSSITVVNWSPENMIVALQLISCSINNVVAALQRVNGVAGTERKCLRPVDESGFDKAWEDSPKVRNMSFNAHPDAGAHRTKSQLLRDWRAALAGTLFKPPGGEGPPRG